MKSRGSDAVVAVAVAAFLTVIVPLQSFIGNCSHYPYSWRRPSLELGVLCLGLATCLFALLKAACGRTLTADEITGLLHDEERLYRFERPDKRGFDEVRRR